MRRTIAVVWVAGLLAGISLPVQAGWNPFSRADDDGKKEEKERKKARSKAQKATKVFRKADPSLELHFESAAGYAVFPGIGKGGIGIGGAYGTGVVYEGGKAIGKTSVKQVTIGFQLGGQKYSELIFFKDQDALDAFKEGNFELTAQISAVAAAAGASKDAAYERGVAVFTMAGKGLMYEATVGGQKFTFDAYGGGED